MEPILTSPQWAALRALLQQSPTTGNASQPLYRRLTLALRQDILDGRLVEGQALPPSRSLAHALGVGRNTVLAAIDQLIAEGFLISRRGSGVRVAAGMAPPQGLGAKGAPPSRGAVHDDSAAPTAEHRRLSDIAQDLMQRSLPWQRAAHAAPSFALGPKSPPPFRPGLPALDRFPWSAWSKALSRRWRAPSRALTSQVDVAGYAPLRRAIAQHLRDSRAVFCDADQILVVNGSQQALDLAVRLLANPGDGVVIEDPGFAGIDGVLRTAGARPYPVPVDAQGACLPPPDLPCPIALLTPSRSYPLGTTMSLSRRLDWLAWARQSAQDRGAGWIIEDDFDCDFRFDGPPLASLQGLEQQWNGQNRSGGGQVLYTGTFTRSLFPSVRLGYLVVPQDLIGPARLIRQMMDGGGSMVAQVALADFMADGFYDAHMRAMRRLYGQRRDFLAHWLKENMGEYLTVVPADGGLHLTTVFHKRTDDKAVVKSLLTKGIESIPLSPFFRSRKNEQGLIFGFAAWDVEILHKSCYILQQNIATTLAEAPHSPLASDDCNQRGFTE